MKTSTHELPPLIRRVKAAAATALATMALIGGTAGAASAATQELAPGESTRISPNMSSIRICLYNHGPRQGLYTLATGLNAETGLLAPYQTSCTHHWWWDEATVTNHGPTYLRLTTTESGWW